MGGWPTGKLNEPVPRRPSSTGRGVRPKPGAAEAIFLPARRSLRRGDPQLNSTQPHPTQQTCAWAEGPQGQSEKFSVVGFSFAIDRIAARRHLTAFPRDFPGKICLNRGRNGFRANCSLARHGIHRHHHPVSAMELALDGWVAHRKVGRAGSEASEFNGKRGQAEAGGGGGHFFCPLRRIPRVCHPGMTASPCCLIGTGSDSGGAKSQPLLYTVDGSCPHVRGTDDRVLRSSDRQRVPGKPVRRLRPGPAPSRFPWHSG